MLVRIEVGSSRKGVENEEASPYFWQKGICKYWKHRKSRTGLASSSHQHQLSMASGQCQMCSFRCFYVVHGIVSSLVLLKCFCLTEWWLLGSNSGVVWCGKPQVLPVWNDIPVKGRSPPFPPHFCLWLHPPLACGPLGGCLGVNVVLGLKKVPQPCSTLTGISFPEFQANTLSKPYLEMQRTEGWNLIPFACREDALLLSWDPSPKGLF